MGRGRRKKRQQRKQRQAQPERAQISLGVAASTTCPLCREPVNSGGSELGTEVCGGCSVAYHRECLLELGGCATLGCVRKGQIPSEPLSHDSSWDRYRERAAAEGTDEAQAPEEEEEASSEGRAARYAQSGAKLGAILGASGGFLAGGIMNSVAGFNLSKGIQWGLLAALAGAVYFGLSAGLIGRLGVRQRPVFGSEFLVLISVFAGIWLGGTLGSFMGAFGAGAALGLPISLAIALRRFGFEGRTRGRS